MSLVADADLDPGIIIHLDNEQIAGDTLQSLSRASYDGPEIHIAIRQTNALTKSNGRTPERMLARTLAEGFNIRNQNYTIWYGYPSYDAPSEKTNSLDVLKQYRSDIKNTDQKIAKDSNILLKNQGGGGLAFIEGNFGQVAGANITEMQPFSPVEWNDDQQYRNLHGALHEIGHNLGAKHGPESVDIGKVLGRAWIANGRYHRTPNVAQNGVDNECNEHVPFNNTFTSKKRIHNVYSECAIRNFKIVPRYTTPVPGNLAAPNCTDCV